MADYNVDNLIDSILDLAKDSEIPRTRVLDYLQRIQDAVLNRRRFQFSEERLVETLSQDSTTYSYDCDHQAIVQVVLSHADVADPIVPTYLSHTLFFDRFPLPDTNTQEAPRYYTDYGGELYWNCPLDRAYTLGLRYIAASKRLEDTDDCTPAIPEEFKEIYIVGALAEVEQYRENFDIAAVHRRRVEDLEADLIARYGLRKLQPGKAKTTRRRVTAW